MRIIDYLFQCPRRECKARGGRVHALAKIDPALCIHTYLILKAGLEIKTKVAARNVPHEVDRRQTVMHVSNMIKEHFPTATSDRSDFYKKFIEKLCKAREGFQIC